MKLSSRAGLRTAQWIACCIFACSLDWTAAAQGVSTTTVQGTVYLANGLPGSGTLQISWPTFTTANNLAVAAGGTTVSIGADGFVSVNLAPNVGATPAGLLYTAVYHLSNGSTSTEYWTVPAAAQATIAQVRAQVMPAAQAVQAVSKTYVDQAIQSLSQGTLTPVGGTLTGPLYLSGDPTQALQAADKHYVDAGVSQALPLSGGAATGSLTAVQLGASYQADQFAGADFGAKLQACLGAINSTYGGTCDARNFSGSVSMAANLTISTPDTTILLPCATITTSSQLIITAGTRNVSLRGCALRGSSSAGGNLGGTVFMYTGAASMIQVGDPTYAIDTQGFHLDNAVINVTGSTSSTAQTLIAYRTQEMELQSLYLLGNSNQTGLTLDGTGNYTGGTLYDIAFTGFQMAVNAIGHQTGNPATTDWLNASTFVRLHVDCPTSNGNPIAGTVGINLAQGDGNTFTGGDVEGCATALHLGPNAQNNTIVGLRNENSTSQVVADSGSSYNSWITAGTMFTGKLTDNGTRNSFLDAFHRSFNGLNGDWYGSQQDATVTNHFRLGIGSGNERGLYSRYQTDYGYRWTIGLSDATAGEQFYQILDELNNLYRLSIGQYNPGQSSTNNQTVINAAGSGAIVLNGSNNSGTGGVVFGSGGPSETTVASVDNAGDADFLGSLQVGGPATFQNSTSVRNSADAEIDQYLWAGATASQKESFIYKDYTGQSQWYMVKDASNNWALNSATGGLDSFKAYQNTNSGDTYVNASNSTGHIRLNYENGSGNETDIYSGGGSNLVAAFLGTTAIKLPGLAASSGHNCLQIDNSGYLSNTGSPCGSGSGTGTVNTGSAGQMAYYSGNGAAVSGINTVPISAGGTGATTAAAALTALGGASLNAVAAQTFSGPVTSPSVNASVNSQINVMAAPYNAKGDCATDDQAAIQAALNAALQSHGWAMVYFPAPPGGCYLTSTLTWIGQSLIGQAPLGARYSGVGVSGVMLRGKPGQDILHVVDPNANTQPVNVSWLIENIVFVVDDSVNAASNFPHRWPGRWATDGAMTSGSATLSSPNSSISCSDVGQPIVVYGAGSGGSNLTTTIANVTPCWPSNTNSGATVTLAAPAAATVNGAKTYVSVANIPVAQTIGNCGIAADNYDGNRSDWTNSTFTFMYPAMRNVGFYGLTGNETTNTCSMFLQGTWSPYGIDVRNIESAGGEFGIIQASPDTNPQSLIFGQDYQKWDHGWLGGTYPWISYNGGGDSFVDMQLSAVNGPQILSASGSGPSGWEIRAPEFENYSGLSGVGWRITGRAMHADGVAFCANGSPAQIDTSDSVYDGGECAPNVGAAAMSVYGVNNRIDLEPYQTDALAITDLGAGNSVTGAYDANPFEFIQKSVATLLNSSRGPNYVANAHNGDFIATGNAANPYSNNTDLFFYPEDIARAWSQGGPLTYANDSTSFTGRSVTLTAPNGYQTFFTTNPTVGAQLPAGQVIFYVSLKCPTSGSNNYYLRLQAGNTTVATSSAFTCQTSYSTQSVAVNFAGYAGQSVTFNVAALSGTWYAPSVAWAAFRPFQGDYNGQQPVLSPTAVSATGATGSGNVVLSSAPTLNGNTTTFANGAAAEQDLVIQPGSTADQVGAMQWNNYSGSAQWKLRKDASNYFRLTDSVNGLDRQVFYQNGQTIVNAGAGSNAVVINGSSGSGTGGLLVQNGGSSPSTVLTVTGSGNTTATGFVAGKFILGSGTMTLATGSAAGSGSAIVCATGHVCDGISGEVTLMTGTSPATGALATLSFPSTHTNSANCMVSAASSTAQLISVTWNESTTALTLTANSALAASTAYQVRYWCGGN